MKKYLEFFAKKYGEYIRDMTSLGNPIILMLITILLFGNGHEILLIAAGLILNETLGSAIKFFFHKTRPNGQKFSHSLEKIDAGSFPSIHSSRITFVMLTIAYFSPEIYIRVIIGLIILTVGYSRVFLKKHFSLDVIGGYVFGSILFYVLTVRISLFMS